MRKPEIFTCFALVLLFLSSCRKDPWNPETCHDGVQNQTETGVDCGAPCAACPNCTDRVRNQGEDGLDCGGPCELDCITEASCNSSYNILKIWNSTLILDTISTTVNSSGNYEIYCRKQTGLAKVWVTLPWNGKPPLNGNYDLSDTVPEIHEVWVRARVGTTDYRVRNEKAHILINGSVARIRICDADFIADSEVKTGSVIFSASLYH